MNVSPVKSFTYRVSLVGLALLTSMVVIAMATILKPSLAAQAAHTLTYDQSATGTISDTNPEDRWTFTAPGQDAISITVARDEKDQPAGAINTIAPELTLQDATGKTIAQAAHDPQTYDNAVIQSTVLPAAGTYTVVVDRFQGQAGKTQGMYSVLVHLIGAGSDRVNYLLNLLTTTPTSIPTFLPNAQSTPDAIPIQPDVNTFVLPYSNVRAAGMPVGSIYNDQWARVYVLDPEFAQNGANTHGYVITAPFQIGIRVYRLNGDLLPTVSLVPLDLILGQGLQAKLNPEIATTLKDLPTPVAYATPGPASTTMIAIPGTHFMSDLSASFSATVTQSGEYALVVSRQGGQQGTTTGQFVVTFDSFIVPYIPNGKMGFDGELITVGDSKKGVVSAAFQASYILNLSGAQSITISVQRTSGNLLPEIRIEDVDGTILAKSDTDTNTFSTSIISKVQLPRAGSYLIVVAGQGENVGVTSGNFKITVSNVSP